MSTDVPSILQAALTLPEHDRANIAFQLLSSLRAPGLLDEQDPKLSAEFERRLSVYDNGAATASSIDDVTQRVREAIRDRTSS